MEITKGQEIAISELLPEIYIGLTRKGMPVTEAEARIKRELPQELADKVEFDGVLGDVQQGILGFKDFGPKLLSLINRQLQAAA